MEKNKFKSYVDVLQAAMVLLGFLVSLCALFLSYSSFIISKKTAQLDEEYKEVTIRPYIYRYTNLDNMEWIFENTGIGPAKIVQLLYTGPNFCFTTKETASAWEKQEQVHQKMRDIINEEFQSLLPADLRKNYPLTLNIGGDLHEMEEIIALNKPVVIFRIEKYNDDIIKYVKGRFNVDVNEYVKYAFYKRILNFSFNFGYCSITERWCHKLKIPEDCEKY